MVEAFVYPHKFVWYNRSHEEFERLTKGKTIGKARVKGKWLFIPLDPGYVLLFGEIGGKLLYHTAGSQMQKKYHLYVTFEDGSFLKTVHQVISKGGRYDEYDLYNHPGKYIRIMDRKAVGNPCPACGSKIEQTRYLGGACYFCPHCQK